jgi:hypothetical protein
MNIIIPINGKNERLGRLFRNPKHLLLYSGMPVVEVSINLLKQHFPEAKVSILTNESYIKELRKFSSIANIHNVGNTESQVETLLRYTTEISGDESVMFVDCDIIPMKVNRPCGNTVYVFENLEKNKQYSNFAAQDGFITKCNEKEEVERFAGAGIYYFDFVNQFNEAALYESSVAGAIKKLILKGIRIKIDTDNNIFRFGTLNDILA